MSTPEIPGPSLLEEFTAEELLEIGKKFAHEATVRPRKKVGDVLKRITNDQEEYRRFDIAMSIMTRTLKDFEISIDQVEKVVVWGRIDEDGDAADVYVNVQSNDVN